MENLQFGFLFKASLLHSKAALMACFPPSLLILLLAFPLFENPFMPTIWHALPGLLEEPALAFLLLNCVTLTIIASSKLGHELEKGKGQMSAMEVDAEKRDRKGNDIIGLSLVYPDTPFTDHPNDIATESVVRPGLYFSRPVKTCHSFYRSKRGGLLLRRSWSLNASFEDRTRHETIKLDRLMENVKEKKLITSRGRQGSRRNEKVGLHTNKSSSVSTEVQKEKLARAGSLTFSHAADHIRGGTQDQYDDKSVLKDDNFDSTAAGKKDANSCSSGRRAGLVADEGPQQTRAPACASAAAETAHPSMDEVWAAIMASKKSDDRTASCLQVKKRSKKSPNSKGVRQLQPVAAAAPTSTPAGCTAGTLIGAPPSAATAATSSPKSGGRVRNTAGKSSRAPPAAAAEKHVETGSGCTGELEELNQRAEHFIERFNRQIRLQRQESLQAQRQTKGGRSRACNLHGCPISYAPGSRRPPRPPASGLDFGPPMV